MQLDLNKLSEAQKKFYVQLLAKSNIEFQKKDNQFIAQIKIDSNKVTQPVVPKDVIKKSKVEAKKTETINPLAGTKKPLSRTVKVGELKTLESLHPNVEIYIHPKRLPFAHLAELIEGIYEKMWTENKRKTNKIKNICLSQWIYQNVACAYKQKIKIQQFLVNLIDSLNHYINKVEGVRVFYNFLSQKWTIEAYFYFLVLRGLLEDITSDRILQKGQSNQGFSSILGYRFRSNPYEKNISEQQVQNFLAVLCNGGLSCSQNKKKSYETLFDYLTEKMFYDQQRRKNYIRFYDLLQTLVNQYVQVDASSCDMSLSKTQLCQDDQSISQLITGQISHDSLLFKKNVNKHNQSLNSYSVSLKPDQEQIYKQRAKQESLNNVKQAFKTLVYQKVDEMYGRLCTKRSSQTSKALEAAVQAISQLDKGFWLRFRGQITDSQLLSIQKLQSMYRQRQNSPILMNKLVKGLLLLPYIREQMINDLKL